MRGSDPIICQMGQVFGAGKLNTCVDLSEVRRQGLPGKMCAASLILRAT